MSETSNGPCGGRGLSAREGINYTQEDILNASMLKMRCTNFIAPYKCIYPWKIP